ncbi:hypothetical protein FOMG_18341 [Fusarium oxysporum f. sp. melonis 26406]|uniref:GH16 domain-containing protein n=1 Tax=Fusarium oxysporum f. sp. melonis 26406 TaxID=1089452 RepID=W9Z9M2_FUSOX|nr:hypothetical protein FOMG_18341 [Fusarium oxysporum f. sp. melonis 26406]
MAHIALFVWFIALLSAVPATTQEDCSAFSIDGPHSAAFDFYRFYDFRGASALDDLPTGDPAAKDRKQPDTLAVSRQTSNSSWRDDWKVTVKYQGQPNEKALARHYVADHVFLDKPGDETQLLLYTDRLRNETQQAGEVYFSETLVDSLSLRVYARITGGSGAVAGFFTYFNDTQESDIEVLTKDEEDRVHFSNQPTENTTTWTTIPGSTHNESRSGSFEDWTVYRLDWLRDQGLSAWYIDGKLIKTSQMNVPVEPSTIYINMWSNGGSFSGRMDYNTNATLEIQWIQMAFNASSVEAEHDREVGSVCLIEDGKAEPTSSGTKFLMAFGLWAFVLVAAVVVL